MAISLGGRIGAVRAREKLSQAAFSRRLGVSQSYLSEVENDKSKPSVEMIIGIAMGFPKVGMKWLLTGIGNAVVEDGHGRPPSTTDDLRDILKEAQGLGLPLGNGEDGEGSPAQIKWPLSAEQEQILMSYLPVRTLLGVGMRRSPMSFPASLTNGGRRCFRLPSLMAGQRQRCRGSRRDRNRSILPDPSASLYPRTKLDLVPRPAVPVCCKPDDGVGGAVPEPRCSQQGYDTSC